MSKSGGVDLDDSASFPRAKADCVLPCRLHVRRFLEHREQIMLAMGGYVFAGSALTGKERRERVKSLFNSLDMDGSLSAWRVRVGMRNGERSLLGFTVPLGVRVRVRARVPGAPAPTSVDARAAAFSFDAYRRVQRVGTRWLAEKMTAMRQFVVTWMRARGDVESRRRLEHPERTLASYVFQEAEGLSRNAKLTWAARGGHTVQNLQHDGVVIALARGLAPPGKPRARQRASSKLGYEQPVEVKGV